MKRSTWFRAVICGILCAALLCGCGSPKMPDCGKEMDSAFAELAGTEAGTLLREPEWMCAGNSVCDWMAMGFSLSGVEEAYGDYLEALRNYVEKCYEENGCLHDIKATEYHRIALTALALGGDPTRFGKTADGADIDLIADGTYLFAGELGKQGLNGWIWALITLDAGGFEVPQNAKYTRETMISHILDGQEESGGFGLNVGSADVDMTAMALQALAPYRENCSEQIEKALAYLQEKMTDDCTFIGYGAENAESTAQTVIALCALGIDPARDSRFCRDGQTLLGGLERFRLSDGTYTHTLDNPTTDMMASEQVLLAQLAVYRFQQGSGRLYDFTGK